VFVVFAENLLSFAALLQKREGEQRVKEERKMKRVVFV
jgi:hypothetical protein